MTNEIDIGSLEKNKDSETLKEIEILEKTIKWFEGEIEPQACGWMYTTIDGLKHRIKFLREK
tara:strand:- start:233 stop:418 length:186 start_codon:yes stop_codon:yes gene_type:complete